MPDVAPRRASARATRTNPTTVIQHTLEVRPGDPNYASLLQRWSTEGYPGTFEKLSEGWQRRAIWPDPTATQPTFVLVAASRLTDAALEAPPRGYAQDLGTSQSSLPGGNRELPKD